MKFWRPLAWSILLMKCIAAQVLEFAPVINVMLRSTKSVEEFEAAETKGIDISALKLEILNGYEQARIRITQTVLPKYGAQMSPTFAGTSGVREPRLARWYIVTTNPALDELRTTDFIAELRRHPDVGMAYKEPPPAPPPGPPIHLLGAS